MVQSGSPLYAARVATSVSAQERRDLEAIATRKRMPLAMLVRRAIELYLQTPEAQEGAAANGHSA